MKNTKTITNVFYINMRIRKDKLIKVKIRN